MPWDFAEELRKYGPGSGDTAVSPGAARAYCAAVTRSHYENFTVASWLLPKALVPHFEAVYAYCRWADDLADETGGGEVALDLLGWWRRGLLDCYEEAGSDVATRFLTCRRNGSDTLGNVSPHNTHPVSVAFRDSDVAARLPTCPEAGSDTLGNVSPHNTHPVFVALRETIRTFAIPAKPFLDLLVAFEQDQRVPKYDTFDQLLGYCRNSANPVGHLVLYLFETFDETKAALSDDICTGLQLANFWQDVARDFEKGRIYLPREDRERFGVTEDQIRGKTFDAAFRELMAFEVQRTWTFFERGRVLLPLLPRKARVDVELFALGGEAVLRAIEKQNCDVLTSRPRIGKFRKARLLGRALLGQLWG